jgi:flagellar hook-length control protein FliK
MKISTDSINATRQQDERKADEQKKSDRFSKLMKSKNEANQAKSSSGKSDAGNGAQQKSLQTSPDSQSVNPLALGDLSSHLSLASTTPDTAKASQASAATPPQVEQLTNEISHQIDVLKQGGKTEGVNITFDSKTLEGLQVQIRPQNGEMAIRFVTQSENVSNLLSKHTGELREALTSKGVKVRNITISSQNAPVIRRGGYASV